MRTERTNFLRRLQAILNACDEPLLVNSADAAHTERAKQLRCGLCVMIFSALEEFVRERVAHALGGLTPVSLPFAMLPLKLQVAATQTALQSLAFQAQYMEDAQKLASLRAEFKKLATAGENHYSISRYSFSNSKTNVQTAEIFDVLDALMVDKPWEAIYHLAKRFQIGTLNPAKQEFEQLSIARHSAAHKQSFDIPNIDLKAKVSTAMSIGIAFDVVLSCAVDNLNTSIARHGAIKLLKSSDIEIFSIPKGRNNGKYRLLKDGAVKAVKSDVSLDVIKAAGLQMIEGRIGVALLHKSGCRDLN